MAKERKSSKKIVLGSLIIANRSNKSRTNFIKKPNSSEKNSKLIDIPINCDKLIMVNVYALIELIYNLT